MSINVDIVEQFLLIQHVLDKKVSISDFKVAMLRHVYGRQGMKNKSSWCSKLGEVMCLNPIVCLKCVISACLWIKLYPENYLWYDNSKDKIVS